ncbi:MAG TPA: DUF1016 domain-containing protein [Eggerthellaceae bacterium]|nr:DUF1016 domain-containing protein [Eggerthellaceae bacterium]
MTMSQPRIVRSHSVHLDDEYANWIFDVKQRFRQAQIKASIRINAEQLRFNWSLGRDLVLKRAEEQWGAGVVEQVSLDLQDEFPNAKGFSARNLWDMKKWYLFYAGSDEARRKLEEASSVPAGKSEKLRQLVAETAEEELEEKLRQPVAGLEFPSIFSFVPWGHHILITRKCSAIDEALFYIRKTIDEGLSRSALDDFIRADLYHVAGTAVTNFGQRLPKAQGAIAQEIIKDTYDLGFVALSSGYDEIALEAALEQNITRFLLELGTGFAFVGRQKEVVVSGKTRRIDMLFYHIRLRCYVVVELKVKPFEPEFAGKLNFYVNAVDKLIRDEQDNPTIGLLICKDRDRTEVQWALEGIQTPMGVATYDNVALEQVRTQLPSDAQIQQRLEQAEREFRLAKEQPADL